MPLGGDKLPKADLDAVRQYIGARRARQGGRRGRRGRHGRAAGHGHAAGRDGAGPGRRGAGRRGAEAAGKPPFHGVFQINLPTTTTLGRRSFEFRIDHRFGRVGAERGAFGLDAGANISYGFAYGILDGWDVMLRRSNSRKGYELGDQVHADPPGGRQAGQLRRLRVGRVLPRLPSNTANPWAGNFQLMLSRLWFERWSTQLVVGYHLRTDHKASPHGRLPDDGATGR
jgi:hypothetical protein